MDRRGRRGALTGFALAGAALAIGCASGPAADPAAYAYPMQAASGAPRGIAVLAPGCGGYDPRPTRQPLSPLADRLTARAFHVVIADYEAALGLKDTCFGRGAPLAAVADAIASAAQAGRAAAGPDLAVFLVGWSLGGSGVLLAGEAAGAAGVVALYPDCTPFSALSGKVRHLLILAGRDVLTPVSECAPLRPASEAAGDDWLILPDAAHGFDYPTFQRGVSVPANRFRERPETIVSFDAALAEQVRTRVVDWLTEAAPGAPPPSAGGYLR